MALAALLAHVVEQGGVAREIEQPAEIFESNKEAPPVTKNQPPVAGAIKWVRSLLERLKRTMAKLLSTEEVGGREHRGGGGAGALGEVMGRGPGGRAVLCCAVILLCRAAL